MPKKIYLASSSPRRLTLMQQLGLSPSVVSASIEETALPNEPPVSFVVRMAVEKAHAGYNRLEGESIYVVGGDTIIVCDGKVFGKPKNRMEASKMLSQLSGKTHQVLSAVALINEGTTYSEKCITEVTFAPLLTEQVESYLNTGEFEGKAGGYAIQGLAASFIKSIEGSYSAVMGLPLFELNQLLTEAGFYEH